MNKFSPTAAHDLYNESLRPIEVSDRTTSPFGMGIVWFGMGVQLTCFKALAPLLSCYTIGEVALVSFLGQALLIILGFIVWDIGLKYGISFATSITASFGPFGGKVVGVLRVVPGLFFLGINGYMGAAALNEVGKLVLGFDNLWVWIIINMALLAYCTIHGTKGIEIFSTLATPLLVIVMGYLAVTVFTEYKVSLSDVMPMGLTGTPRSLVYGICVTVGGYASVLVGMNDYGKDLKTSEEEIQKGWWARNKKYFSWSLILGVLGYTAICTLAVICVTLTGTTNPLPAISQMMSKTSVLLAVVVQLFIFAAQFSTNVGANIYPAVYVVCSLAPKYIKAPVAAFSFAGLAVILRTWEMTNIDAVMNVFASTVGPIFAVVVVDYYVFRHMNYSLDDIYKTHGKYYYWHGFNIPAMIVCIFGTSIALMFPDYGLIVGIIISCILYYVLVKFVFAKKMPVLVSEETTAQRKE